MLAHLLIILCMVLFVVDGKMYLVKTVSGKFSELKN